jgi:hypothetical protein
MDTPLVNGVRHSWASIEVQVLGRIVTGITAMSYEDKQEKANAYGKGVMPVHRSRGGKYEASSKITLHEYEVRAIQRALPRGKRIQDVPMFDITVSYLDDNDAMITDVIRNCEFTNNKREIKQGDTVIEVELELIVSHIDWN